MKGSRNHRVWRHHHTGTPHHLPLPHRPAAPTSDAVWRCRLQRPPPNGEAWNYIPLHSVLDSALVICGPLFVIIHLPTPLLSKYLFLWWLSASYAGVLLYSRLLRVGGTRPGICTPFLRCTLSMEISLRPKALNYPITNERPVYISALTSPQNPDTQLLKPLSNILLWSSTPNWQQSKLNSWFQNLASHCLTHLRNSITPHPAA